MDSTKKNSPLPEGRDFCRHSCRDLASKENCLLAASLWHGLFFPSIQSKTAQCPLTAPHGLLPDKEQINEKEGTQIDGKGILRLLEATGYSGVREVLFRLEKPLAANFENEKTPSSGFLNQVISNVGERSGFGEENKANVDFDNKRKFALSWQQCFCMCAAEYIMTKSSSLGGSLSQEKIEPTANLTPFQTVLQMALDMHMRYQRKLTNSSAGCADELSKWFSQIAHAIISRGEGGTGVNEEMNPIETTLRLFDLGATEDGASSIKTSDSAVGVAFQEQSCLRHVFYTSMLYGALCISSSYTVVRPLAVLLTAYIYQGYPTMRELLLNIAYPTASKSTACTGAFDKDFSPAFALTRLRGVIAGILEYTLRFRDVDPIAVRHALDRLMEEKESDSCEVLSLEGISSVPGRSSGLLQSAIILLMQLIQQTVEWSTARRALNMHGTSEPSPNTKASPLSTDDPEPVMAAREIVHAIQELLFTVVLGAGTVRMPNRPSAPAVRKPSQANKSTHMTRSIQKSLPEIEGGWMVATRRALTLGEADALCEELFPALLQQLGWEWPWSELLRQCRVLDKQQQAPPFPLVAWSSHQLIDTILMRVSQRTYPRRLQHVLPRSFHRALEALGLFPDDPASTSDGGAEAEEGTAGEGRRSPQLFPMPPYYANAGDIVIDYLRLSGLDGVRVEEVEHVLAQATSTLPMIVQLRALAPPTTGYDNRGGGKGSAQQADDEERPMRSGHGGRYLLTAERVVELEARYRAEVLLASVVVYTQLSVPSQVQSLMRTLAPLFDKLSSLCSRSYSSFTPYLIVPSSTNSASLFYTNENKNTDSATAASAFGLTFSKEVEHLINAIGYQFYSLEWMPAVAAAYHDSIRSNSSDESNNTGNASRCITSSALPYSMFAAVAHQFNASFNISLGSSGGPSQRHPAGAPSTLIVPSRTTARSSGAVYLDSNLGSNISDHSVNGVVHWKRAELFLQVLLLDCFLGCRSSSCELEGTMAVAATRRVHISTGNIIADHKGPLLKAAGNLRPGILEAFWARKAFCSPPKSSTEVNVERTSSSNRNDDVDNSSRKRTRQEEEQAPPPTKGDNEDVKILLDVLLQYGAASFATTIESKDIILALMQSFIHCTALGKDGSDKKTLSKVRSEKTSTRLLQQASVWAQEMVGSQASHSRVQMLLRQKLQPAEISLPASLRQIHSVYHTVFNSCTWDSCSPARRIFRQVPSRILEKTKLRRAVTDNLTKWRDAYLQARFDAEATSDINTSSQMREREVQNAVAVVDPLLRYQWVQWKGILDKLEWKTQGADAEFTHESALHHSEVPDLSTSQWLWYSPYFTQSL